MITFGLKREVNHRKRIAQEYHYLFGWGYTLDKSSDIIS